jgi:putative FmdB family regulatory protein
MLKLGRMPVYMYQGLESGATFSLEQRISEAALTHHPETGEAVKRLIGKPAISFKGSGFYANDSKSAPSKSETPKTETPKPETAKTENSSSEPKAESKEAPSAPVTTAPTVKSDAA